MAAWIPYFALQFVLGQEPSAAPFLVAHLSGVVPGAILRHWGLILAAERRLKRPWRRD